MSRRKIKTPQSLKNRKLKRYLFQKGKDEKKWQEHCQQIAIKQRQEKRKAEEEKKKAEADEDTK